MKKISSILDQKTFQKQIDFNGETPILDHFKSLIFLIMQKFRF